MMVVAISLLPACMVDDEVIEDAPRTEPVPPNLEDYIPSCGPDLQRDAELSFHMTQGQCDATLCSFDYDPVEEEITRINGEFDIQSGDFWWSVEYHPDHWRVSTGVSGHADFVDGDESSTFDRRTLDIAGVLSRESVTVDRVGCNLTVERLPEGMNSPLVLSGKFIDAEFEYQEDQLPPRHWGGDFVVTAGGTRTHNVLDETVSVSASPTQDPYWSAYSHNRYINRANDQNLVEFNQSNPFTGASRWGYCVETLAGVSTCDVELESDSWGFAYFKVDYFGDGGGIYESEDDWCEVSFVAGDCSMVCDNAGNADCSAFTDV